MVIMFAAQTKLNTLTKMMSELSCPLCSMIAAITDESPSLKEIEGKKPSSSIELIMKLSSIAPSRKDCQVSRMSTTFSAMKPSASAIATLTFISVAIVLSPPFSLSYYKFSYTVDVKMAYHYLSLPLGVMLLFWRSKLSREPSPWLPDAGNRKQGTLHLRMLLGQ